MQHLGLHAGVLSPNRAVYDGGSGFNRNAAGGPRSYCAIDYGQSRSIPVNIFYYLSNELVALEREANMHDIATFHGCGQVNIYFDNSMSLLDNLGQRFPNFAQPDNYHCLTRLFLFQCENEFKP